MRPRVTGEGSVTCFSRLQSDATLLYIAKGVDSPGKVRLTRAWTAESPIGHDADCAACILNKGVNAFGYGRVYLYSYTPAHTHTHAQKERKVF